MYSLIVDLNVVFNGKLQNCSFLTILKSFLRERMFSSCLLDARLGYYHCRGDWEHQNNLACGAGKK